MSLRHALLGLLAEKPSSGYDLMKRFETSLALVWPARQSQIYTELGKLNDGGLIEVIDSGARNRREYGITEPGRRELQSWLTESDLDISYRSAALLRVFFLWTLTQQDAVAYLETFASRNQGRQAALAQIRDTEEWMGDPAQLCAWLALEFGLQSSQAAEKWARWAATEMTAHSGENSKKS